MKKLTLAEFQAAYKAQADRAEDVVFRCPACKTLQSANDLIRAGAGDSFETVNGYLGFSCIGRFTGATSPRRDPDGKPCNWTLGGLFRIHEMEVITPDGTAHPHFELATREEADEHRSKSMEGSAK